MNTSASDENSMAGNAISTLQRDRAELLAALKPPAPVDDDTFPRSATFRFLTSHVNARSLLATAALTLGRMWLRRLLRAALR